METSAVCTKIDKLQMYFTHNYFINNKVSIHIPSIQEIVDWGEDKYYGMISSICSIPSDMKSVLWDNGVDWEEISDFEYFIMISRNYTVSDTAIVFGTLLDFSKMEIKTNDENQEIYLYDKQSEIKIDKVIYQRIVDYLRVIHSISPEIEHAYNRLTKKMLIEYDRQKILEAEKDKKETILLPLISSMVNSSGFKYNIDELRNITIFQFMDSVNRIQIITSTDALIKGMYSGMIDVSKIDKKEFNWLRDITVTQQSGEELRISTKDS